MLVDMIGDRLKELRLAAGMSQPEFAAIVGTSKQYVSQLENGKNKMPSGEYLEGWARHLRVNPRWLVSGTGPKHAETPAGGGSHRVRLDPTMIAETHRALRKLEHAGGRDFSLENVGQAARFVQMYEIRATMSARLTRDEWTEFEQKLVAIMAPTGGDDGRTDGVPADGTGTKKVARGLQRKA